MAMKPLNQPMDQQRRSERHNQIEGAPRRAEIDNLVEFVKTE